MVEARAARSRGPRTGEARGNSPSLGDRLRRGLERADRAQQRRRWTAIPVAILRKFSDDHAGRHAALIAYYGLFSLFPLLLVLVTVLGFVIQGDPGLQERLLDSALGQFPIIGEQIRGNVRALTGSFVTLAIGLSGALWSGLAVISAVRTAMDELWNVPRREQPSFVRSKLQALAALGILGVAALLAAFLASIGTNGGWLGPPLRVAALIGTAGLNVAVFAAIFRVLTVANIPWRTVLPGAVVAGLTWVAMLAIGSWLVGERIRDATHVYGFFAIVIGLLAWVYLGAQMMLLCAELNVVLARKVWPRSAFAPNQTTEPDRRALAGEAKEEAAHPDETVDVRFEDQEREARSG